MPDATARKRRTTKSLALDKDKIVEHVLASLNQDVMDRQDWMDMRLQRYAKYRGWLEETEQPWPGSANPHIPMLMWNVLRLQAQLHNAVLSVRPVMSSQAWQRKDRGKQEKLDNLLDWQVFMEADGARKLDEFIQGFVEDGPTVMHIPWVKETRTIHDVRVFPGPDRGHPDAGIEAGWPDEVYFRRLLEGLFNPARNLAFKDEGYSWTFEYQNEAGETQKAAADFYFRDDGQVEMHLRWKPVVYNGPCLFPEDLEDIVVPWRCANLQPPGQANPRGAPHVSRISKVRLDDIRRRRKDGTFDLLTDDDLKAIEATPASATPGDQSSAQIDEPKRQKDEIEGVERVGEATEEEQTSVEWYGRWDADGDGLEEDVIFWVLKESRKLARARYLTHIYPSPPGMLPRRPFAEAHMLPVRNRWYSLGMIELLEHLHDLITGVFKMNLDWGELGNSPFFFYEPSSGMKPEIIRLYPGEGYPVTNPGQNVVFPNLPARDQAWAFNMLTLLNQFVERTAMIGELQFGRVPTGKASALRTLGTTAALLQQSDIRADQILLRLFQGIEEIYQQVHCLNQRYLPKQKQIRVVGVPKAGEDAYMTVASGEVTGRYDFRWKSTLFSSDKHMLAQTLLEISSVIVSPLTMQLGLIDREKTYRILRDYIKARQQDPDAYLVRPPEMVDVPRMLAEEAISSIIQGEFPEAMPLEPPVEHYRKLLDFVGSDAFGLLEPATVALFRRYLERVRKFVEAQMQQEAMAKAAAMFQSQAMQAGAGGGQPPGQGMVETTGRPPTLGQTPPLQANELSAEDLVHG